MQLTSPAFSEGSEIPPRYTCDGEDISPPLEIAELPEGAESLALVMDDPDAPGRTFVHWVAYDIEPAGRIEEAASIGTGGLNHFGRKDYGGPCPPSGSHRYVFKLYALGRKLGRQAGLSKEELLEEIEGSVLAEARLTGTYQRR
jgi:Raf kinase inhibitor-like YbhB/YbcL family protein